MADPAVDDLADFREKARQFLAGHTQANADLEASRQFHLKAAEAGLAGLRYETKYGGAGLSAAHERAFQEEAANFPPMAFNYVISHGMCLPMLNDFGTEEQKLAYMTDCISGTTMWCQMFSEPGAGSDVASLQTKADRDGDEWIINGQKVWTTRARESNYGILIARTDPAAVKHAGISMFIVPMDHPGVEIRPIHQIDGRSSFNEVFFTDVNVPVGNLLGEVNNGWNQATAMLMYERVAIGGLGSGSIQQPNFDLLMGEAERAGRLSDPIVRQNLARIYSMETAKALLSLRTKAEMKAGKAPGPGGSLGKLFGSVIQWEVRKILMNVTGASSQAWDGEGPASYEDSAIGAWQAKHTVGSFASSIAGGTDEIQRNIIGDRVLGLPRDISVDRGVPFNELTVGTQRS